MMSKSLLKIPLCCAMYYLEVLFDQTVSWSTPFLSKNSEQGY